MNALNMEDKDLMQNLKLQFNNATTNDLIRHVYINYPYYAINSEIAPKHLLAEELKIVEKFTPKDKNASLFTIGYEGRSLKKYLNILIQKNIKILCDVRKNPLSRKYGFSKKTLQNACESVNIKYIHLPELGIVSKKRKNLICQTDYDNLFADYEETVLPFQGKTIKYIHDLLNNYIRVALTCYEAMSEQCHRTRVANAVHNLEKSIPLKHL